MTIKPIYKKAMLYGILLVTLLLTAYTMYEESIVNKSTSLELAKPSDVPNVVPSEASVPDKTTNLEEKVDIFEVYNKPRPVEMEVPKPQVIQKKVEVVEPPPVVVPSAPPLPFKYIGKIWGDDEFQVFVGFEGKYLVVKEGDTIQKTYKVEKIAPPIMTVTYIPMDILQDMQIGEMN